MAKPKTKPSSTIIMYLSAAVVSVTGMIALIALKPVTHSFVRGKDATVPLPSVNLSLDTCLETYQSCYQFPPAITGKDKASVDSLAKTADINPILLVALWQATQTSATAPTDISGIAAVADTYRLVRDNNGDSVVPSVFTNRLGSYQLTQVNHTGYLSILVLSHLIKDETLFNERVMGSNDSRPHTLTELVDSLTQ